MEDSSSKKAPKYQSVFDLAKDYDVFSRKVAPSPEGIMNEVDAAFHVRGAPFRIYTTTGSPRRLIKEKVFANHPQGAIDFAGRLSDVPGQRLYGVIQPKGLIQSRSLITAGKTMGVSEFTQVRQPHQFFQQRFESGRWQTHIHSIHPGRVSGESAADVFNKSALGVVEFDSMGNIIRILWK